jgi:bacterial/archaeal transporter family-2 protein
LTVLYLFTIGVGVASAMQAGCTAALAKGLHNPFLVVLASLLGSFIVIGLAGSMLGGFGLGRAEPATVPWWAWLAGAGGAAVLLSQPVAAHALGASAYLGTMVTAAIVASVALDHFGVLGFAVHPAGVWRLAGAALMVLGVGLVARF